MPQLLAERLDVLHDRPDIRPSQIRFHRRHLRLGAAVPNSVEHHAIGVASGHPSVREIASGVAWIGLGTTSRTVCRMTPLTLGLVQTLAFREHGGVDWRRVGFRRRPLWNLPAV